MWAFNRLSSDVPRACETSTGCWAQTVSYPWAPLHEVTTCVQGGESEGNNDRGEHYKNIYKQGGDSATCVVKQIKVTDYSRNRLQATEDPSLGQNFLSPPTRGTLAYRRAKYRKVSVMATEVTQRLLVVPHSSR